MKKIALAAVAALIATANALAASPAATQDWVRRFLATNGVVGATYTQSLTNGVFSMTASDGAESVTIRGEVPDRLAVIVGDVTDAAAAMGVTNGMRFAWNGTGEFVNGSLAIVNTQTGFTFDGVQSSVVGGVDTIPGYFTIRGTRITNSEADAALAFPQTSFVARAFRAFCRAASAVASVVVPTANAEPWKDRGAAWYTPQSMNYPDSYEWQVVDTSGNISSIQFTRSGDGFINNANEVLATMKSSVQTLFKNVAGLSNQIVQNTSDILLMDEAFQTMASQLDEVFGSVFGKLQQIEKRFDDGSSETYTVSGMNERGVLTIVGGTRGGGVRVDGETISTNSNGIGLYAKPSKGTATRMFPYYYGSSLKWCTMSQMCDGETIGTRMNDENESVLTLNGFDGAESCAETLSDMLTNEDKGDDRAAHKIMTKYTNGNESKLHLLSIGDMISTSVSDTNAVDVITGIQFQVGDGDDGKKKVQYKLTRTRIVAWVGESTTDATWTDILTTSPVDVVTKSEYDTSSHQFSNYKKTVQAFSSGEEEIVSPAVFEAQAASDSE